MLFCYLQVVSIAIIDKYIGESARFVREMFSHARDHQVVLIDKCIFSRNLSEDICISYAITASGICVSFPAKSGTTPSQTSMV